MNFFADGKECVSEEEEEEEISNQNLFPLPTSKMNERAKPGRNQRDNNKPITTRHKGTKMKLKWLKQLG